MKKRQEFKTKKKDSKSRIPKSFGYAELCKMVREGVTEDIKTFNFDLKKALENNKCLKLAKYKLCVGRNVIFALQKINGKIIKYNNEILIIVKNFYHILY